MGLDYGPVYDYLRNLNPTGELRAEDYAAGENLRGRLVSAAGETGGGLRMQALRRYRTYGLGTSPAQETSLQRIGEQEALAREHAGTSSEEYLSNLRLGRERFGQQKGLLEFQARINEITGNRQRHAISQASFLNSLLEFTPAIISAFA